MRVEENVSTDSSLALPPFASVSYTMPSASLASRDAKRAPHATFSARAKHVPPHNSQTPSALSAAFRHTYPRARRIGIGHRKPAVAKAAASAKPRRDRQRNR